MKNYFLLIILLLIFNLSCTKQEDAGKSLDSSFSDDQKSAELQLEPALNLQIQEAIKIIIPVAESEDLPGWEIYDKTPEGATYTQVIDEETQKKVVELSGEGTSNGYRFKNHDTTKWNNSTHFLIEWSMKYSENYTVYFDVETSQGHRYIYYTPVDYDNLGDKQYIHHGLGKHTRNGKWNTFIVDLEADLIDAQPETVLLSVNAILIRGSGRIGDIILYPTKSAFLATSTIGTGSGKIISTPNVIDCGSDCFEILASGKLQFKAIAEAGSVFTGWNNPACSPTSNECILEIQEEDLALSANFSTKGIYEDQTISGWDIYDNTPEGAIIENVLDQEKNSYVIKFTGDGTQNGYRLRRDNGMAWNNPAYIIEWSMKFTENFNIYIDTETTEGQRYIYYNSAAIDKLGDGQYVHHGLGANSKDGTWKTYKINLQADLEKAQPGVKIIATNGFLIRGNGLIDDIKLYDDKYSFLSVEHGGNGVGLVTSSTQNINCGPTCFEIFEKPQDSKIILTATAFSGSDFIGWEGDCSGSETCEPDLSENKTARAIFTSNGLYEDAEDSTTLGWEVYDKTPEGAEITNIFDEEKNSRVIKFKGTQRDNGFRLRKADGTKWQYLAKYIQWSMNFKEAFTIYIDVETNLGHRYIYYTPSTKNNLGDKEYVHYGLGAVSMNGTWQVFKRDLQADLTQAQPEAIILEINGFLIRGSGKVDDIKLADF